MDLVSTLWDRIAPATGGADLDRREVLLPVVIAVAVCLVPGLWRWVRIVVTLVHELGHAGVGVLVGRRFTGFVVRGDMSGHAVTSGRATGPGRVATTWAGYPMPGIVGAALVAAGPSAYAAPALSAVLLALVVVLIRVRSAGTLVTVLVALAATGAAWWWRSDVLQTQLLVGLGVVLLVGGWRHLGAVTGGGRPRGGADVSDPAVLRRLTGIPRPVWTGSYVLVLAVASWLALRSLLAAT